MKTIQTELGPIELTYYPTDFRKKLELFGIQEEPSDCGYEAVLKVGESTYIGAGYCPFNAIDAVCANYADIVASKACCQVLDSNGCWSEEEMALEGKL